jgi:hypothetical protein
VRARAGENFTWNAMGGAQAITGYEPHAPTDRGSSEYDDLKAEQHGPDANGPLTPARQIALMRQLPLAELVGLPGYQPLFHSGSMTLADVRKTARLSEGGSPCRAELLLTDLTYARVYAHGHSLRAFWVLRDFGTGTSPKRRSGLPEEVRLMVPVEETKRTGEAFVADLERAFTATLEQFGRDLRPIPKP